MIQNEAVRNMVLKYWRWTTRKTADICGLNAAELCGEVIGMDEPDETDK